MQYYAKHYALLCKQTLITRFRLDGLIFRAWKPHVMRARSGEYVGYFSFLVFLFWFKGFYNRSATWSGKDTCWKEAALGNRYRTNRWRETWPGDHCTEDLSEEWWTLDWARHIAVELNDSHTINRAKNVLPKDAQHVIVVDVTSKIYAITEEKYI